MAKPFIPWVGGKTRMAAHLLPLFPKHTCYVEPFAGAAALLFLKEPSKAEVLNDLNGELVNLYRVVKHHLIPLYEEFKWCLTARAEFQRQKKQPPECLTDIQRAARFLYLQRHSYAAVPKHNSYATGALGRVGINLLRLEENLSQAHLRLHQVNIENLGWDEVIDKYDRPTTFFYLDPPYYKSADYGFPAPLSLFEDIAAKVKAIKAKAMISVSDRPEMREVFGELDVEAVSVRYSVKTKGGKCAPGKELVIRNW